MKWGILLIAGVIFITGCTGQVTQTSAVTTLPAPSPEGITTGAAAKDFSLVDIDKNVIKLSDFQGKYVIISFMATWCVPCQIEADNIRKVQNENDFVVIQLDIDPRESNIDLIKFKENFGNNDWIMAFDDNFEIAKLYNVRSFDTTIIVDPKGEIIYRDEGWPIDVKTLRDLLKGDFEQLVLGSTHEHAKISVIIKGEKIDFSQQKYQLRSPYIHFEDNDGETLHIHAKGVTLDYFFGTLNWKFEDPCLRTDFSEFCDGKLTIAVNGDKKNIEHKLKEGDVIEVVYDES